ncbi:MAG: hypothetical protein ACYC06_08620 [Ilumatobacteraceae bacterium]
MPNDQNRRRPGLWTLLGVLVLALGACSSIAERAALCDRSIGLENEFSAVSLTLDDIAIATPLQLTNTFAVTVSTLTTLFDLGPSSLRSDLGVLLDVYESLAASIEATGWNGQVAVSDPVVIKVRAQLISNEVVEARNAVRSYTIKNCSAELIGSSEVFQGTPTTLPNPVIPNDNAPDPETGFDKEDTIASSYGYFIAERYNLAITNEQAICIGLAVADQALSDLQKADEAYTEFVAATFAKCGVEANISGS